MSHHHHHHEHHHQPHCKSLFLAYVLWFFLGIFGIHRFYINRPISGIIYLLTAGIFGIGWLVDLFLLPSMVRHYNSHYFSQETIIVAPSPIVYQTSQPYQANPYQSQPYQSGSQNYSQYQPQPYQPQPYQPQPQQFSPPPYQP